MPPHQNAIREQRKRTLYVTGFNPKLTNRRVLFELFNQGGPVESVYICNTHAYVTFYDEESASYCLALFNEIELHGKKLRISPKYKTNDAYLYLKYLMAVRSKLMSEYLKLSPPIKIP